MKIRATKTMQGKFNDRILTARMQTDREGHHILMVEELGAVSPLEFHMFGFKVVEAVTDEVEKLKRGGYRDFGRMGPFFEKFESG